MNILDNIWSKGAFNYDRWFEENAATIGSANAEGAVNVDENEVTKRSDIIIVVDPGHGGTVGNTGGVYVKAIKHKVKGTDGKPQLNTETQEPIIQETLIDAIPDYVDKEIKKTTGWEWITAKVYDQTITERDLVWDVGTELKDLLVKSGYTAYLTRTEKMISGKEDRSLRNKFANDKKAHYFISIHSDSVLDHKISGSHAIYRTKSDASYDNRQKTFAEDILSFFTVVNTSNSPRKDNNIQVLSPTDNLTPRKTLVELGFITNTKDKNAMFANKALMAKQIAKGLEKNIEKYFYTKTQRVVGYQPMLSNKVYKTRELARLAYIESQRTNNIGAYNPFFVGPIHIKEVYEETRTPISPIIL